MYGKLLTRVQKLKQLVRMTTPYHSLVCLTCAATFHLYTMTSVSSRLYVCCRGGPRLATALRRGAFPLSHSSSSRALSSHHVRPAAGYSACEPRPHIGALGSKVYSRPFGLSSRLLATQNGATPTTFPHKKPKAVIFDLGGVVVPTPQPIFDRFEEKHNLKHGSIIKTIKATDQDGAFAKMERGELTVEAFAEPFAAEYKKITGVEITTELVQEFMRQLSDFTKITPNSGVIEIIERLRSEGIKVAILTNNFIFDNGQTVFPRQQLKNVDVVSRLCNYLYL